MEIATIVWLVLFGALLIATFSTGTYYLSEWKTGLIDSAKYKAKDDPKHYAEYIAEGEVKAKLSLPIWITSFAITFSSIIGVIVVLISCL